MSTDDNKIFQPKQAKTRGTGIPVGFFATKKFFTPPKEVEKRLIFRKNFFATGVRGCMFMHKFFLVFWIQC